MSVGQVSAGRGFTEVAVPRAAKEMKSEMLFMRLI